MDSWQHCCLPVTVRTINKMLSSIKQVKVGRGIPMLCIRSIVHYSRIVIQLNMYVKIITSSGFKSTILTDSVQGQLRVPFRFGRCLKFPGSTLIYRKLSSSPQALRLRARLDTKWKKNRSRIYDLGVVPTRGNKAIYRINRIRQAILYMLYDFTV